MSNDKRYPLIGVGVMIRNERGKILMGLRRGSHSAGEWCFPGGHLDFGETIFQTAEREVLEETGLNVRTVELFSVSDDFRYIDTDGKHYVTIGVLAEYLEGEPQLLETDRCDEWRWFAPDALPDNLFEGTWWMIENSRSGRIYEPARKSETVTAT
ncbi:MAG: hypothetical protein AUJ19_03655 [Parcubacteria group bacterium CG1_02_58_44]|nr:MAG: hypothetical protein AUJ19_03655 [Parcubacteria group bacterium CG1_02_58_44]